MKILGTLRRIGETEGAVRVEDVYDTDIDDLWDACTNPARLARWVATVPGGLRQGDEFDASFTSGFQGRCRIEMCEPPHRLLVTTWDSETGDASTMEARLEGTADGTRLVIEESGVPVGQLAGYGAGWQVHAEDLARHVAGEDRDEDPARWSDMVARYREVDTA